MYIWLMQVKLEDNNLPRFNDSLIEDNLCLDEIIKYAFSYLRNSIFDKKSYRDIF